MLTLLQKQFVFSDLVGKLLAHAYSQGYTISLGDAYRDPRVFGPMGTRKGYGESNSCHKLRLAIDLNLFRDGKFLTSTEAHRPLGEWWEAQHSLARWGGRFNDGNHYSFEHQGNK